MRKLTVTCDCGQRLQVPYSALGRMGMCSTCGRKMRITADNARRDTNPDSPAFSQNLGPKGAASWIPPQEAKEQFGRAVDLYTDRQYGEALVIFDELRRCYPDNSDIQQARTECLKALRSRNVPALEDRRGLSEGDELNEATVRRIVLEKLLYGGSEMVQVEAARVAAEILGMKKSVDAPEAPPLKGDRDNDAEGGEEDGPSSRDVSEEKGGDNSRAEKKDARAPSEETVRRMEWGR